MSCAFVLVRSRQGIDDARHRIDTARQYVPIVAEKESIRELQPNIVCAAFSNAVESAAGGYVHEPPGEAWTVYNGWVRGPVGADENATCTIAEEIAERIRATSFEQFVRETTGGWSLLFVGEHGEIHAATDFLGGEHIYYGVVEGVFAISNRALLCAAALHGSIPAPNPWMLGWLLTQNQAFVSEDETPFSGVRALHPLTTLKLAENSETFEIRPRQATTPRQSLLSWDDLASELVDRARIVRRLADVRFRLSLTGGRDSRLVLAALVAAKCIDRIGRIHLILDPKHPDALVAEKLAHHYGVPFECELPEPDREDLWRKLEIHNFQTEMGFMFWDAKGFTSARREGHLGGYYGEICRSHAYFLQVFGWQGAARVFERDAWVDPVGVLHQNAKVFYRDRMRQYWQRRRDEGLTPMQVRDRWHRDARMWRWAAQSNLSEGLGMVNIHPIPSRRLLDRYLTLSWLDQFSGRVHFELMKRCDPWLVEQPFGTAGFPWWVGGKRDRRIEVPPSKHPIAPQRLLWQSRRREIEEYLLRPSQSAFFEIVDKNVLEQKLRSMNSNSHQYLMNMVLGALGVRHALEEKIRPLPCKVDGA